MSSCVCKILFKSEQICGCCCKMLRDSLFWDTRYIWGKFLSTHHLLHLAIWHHTLDTFIVNSICILSYDQLWAALLTGRNAVTWRWALSYVHRFTVTRCDLIMSRVWHYNVTPGDVTWCSLNANVRYILRCFCLRLVCFLASYCKFLLIQFKSINKRDFAVTISTVINTYS